MSPAVGGQGDVGCGRVVGRGPWGVLLKAEAACRKLGEEWLRFCPASCSMSFGNLTGRGKLDLIISDKPLFPIPESCHGGGGRRMLDRVRALFVKDGWMNE